MKTDLKEILLVQDVFSEYKCESYKGRFCSNQSAFTLTVCVEPVHRGVNNCCLLCTTEQKRAFFRKTLIAYLIIRLHRLCKFFFCLQPSKKYTQSHRIMCRMEKQLCTKVSLSLFIIRKEFV